MRAPAPIKWVLLILILIGFLIGAYTILDDRISESELFPVYSSKRTDPLGMSLFRDALEKWPAIDSVSENRSPTTRLTGFGGETTFLRLGMTPQHLRDERYELDGDFLEGLAAGGTVVISLTDKVRRRGRSDDDLEWDMRRSEWRKEWENSKSESDSEPDSDGESEKAESWIDFIERQRVLFDAEMRLENGPTLLELFELSVEEAKGDLPEEGYPLFESQSKAEINLDRRWKSRLYFDRESDDSLLKSFQELGADLPEETSQALIAQRVKLRPFLSEGDAITNHYETDHGSVAVSASYGEGEVWLISDTYPFSNEALKADPFFELLFAPLKGAKEIIFDERIHGAKEAGGFMHVMVAYRLHGIFWGLACVALIWVWRTSASLLPPRGASEAVGDLMTGEDTASGLQSLLRNSVPREKLAATLFSCWEEAQRMPISESKKQQVSAALAKLTDGSRKTARDSVAVLEDVRQIIRSR